MRILAGLFVALLCVSACTTTTTTQGAMSGVSPSSAAPTTTAQPANSLNFASTLNAQRRASSLPALRENAQLTAAAQAHASFMASAGQLSHRGAGGSSHSDRISAQGYCWRVAVENVLVGAATKEAAMSQWMASPGHRANIENGRVTEFGIGKSGPYWALVMAAPC